MPGKLSGIHAHIENLVLAEMIQGNGQRGRLKMPPPPAPRSEFALPLRPLTDEGRAPSPQHIFASRKATLRVPGLLPGA